MSVNDKMTAIADAIRAKTGGTEPLTMDQMAMEIAGIQAAPVLQERTITENGTYTPDEGVDGFSKVTVSVADPAGTSNVLFLEGEIEFSDAYVTGMEIPVDDITLDRYVANAWVVETGTVVDGAVTIDDKPTIPANSNRWATAFGITEAYFNGEKVESIDVVMGSSEYTYTTVHTGGMTMRAGPSSEHFQYSSSLQMSDNGIMLFPNNSRYFCTPGYYAKYRYTVIGIKGVSG